MLTWAIISQKGGQGKTTIATGLAVEATKELGKDTVVVLDTDDRQATAAFWEERRQSKDVLVVNTGLAVMPLNHKRAKDHGASLVLIDTPANSRDIATEAAALADIVLIPVVPRAFDIASVMQTVKQVKLTGKPFAVVLNQVKATGREGDDTEAVFAGQGVMVFKTRLHDRKDFSNAGAAGMCVTEFDPKSKAAAEFLALYEEVKRLSGFSAKRLRAERAA
jgi:chromosome partitioning protein